MCVFVRAPRVRERALCDRALRAASVCPRFRAHIARRALQRTRFANRCNDFLAMAEPAFARVIASPKKAQAELADSEDVHEID